MAEVLFPARQRCKKCSRGLGRRAIDPVFDGLYCSPVCAGVAVPAIRPDDAPRECVTQRGKKWVFKRRYRSESEIPDKIREDLSTSAYRCTHCRHLHTGHSRIGEAEQFRMFNEPADDLAEVLIKLRGKATRAQVAAAAGVRPIRIKELEEGVVHPELWTTLDKVLAVYGARLGVSLRTQ